MGSQVNVPFVADAKRRPDVGGIKCASDSIDVKKQVS